MVFHTAPPQPASKARITWSPQLVGGPDASQKGLGHRMPAKLVVRSAIVGSYDSEGGAFAIGYGIHHFAATIDTVTAREVLGIGGAAGGSVNQHRSARRFYRQH